MLRHLWHFSDVLQVLEFLKSQEHFLDRVLYHLGTSAIMDLLLRLVTSMEPTECRNSCVQVICILSLFVV